MKVREWFSQIPLLPPPPSAGGGDGGGQAVVAATIEQMAATRALEPSPMQCISTSPLAFCVHHFITAAECEAVIGAALQHGVQLKGRYVRSLAHSTPGHHPTPGHACVSLVLV